MIREFEVGKWYAWVGPKERPDNWNSEGEMDSLLSGEPFLCTTVVGGFMAHFEGLPKSVLGVWSFHTNLYHFEEAINPEFHGFLSAHGLVSDYYEFQNEKLIEENQK